MENSEDRYQQLISNIPAALYQFELTADGMSKLNYVSPRFSEMFELSESDVIADIAVLFDRIVPEDLAEIYRSIDESAKSGQNWTWEGRVWEYDLTIDRFNFVSDRIVALFGYPISDWLEQPDFWQVNYN